MTVQAAGTGTVRTRPAPGAVDPLPALVVLGLPVVILLCLWLQQAALLRVVFPAAALLAALLLHRRWPLTYLTVTLWLWLLTPLLRRVIDEQAGWQESNPVLLAPYLASAAAALPLLLRPGRLQQPHLQPFGLLLIGIGVGTAVGLVRSGLSAAVFGALEYTVPVLVGVAVATTGRSYAAVRQVVWWNVVIGVAVLSVYGVLQFFAPASWDLHWLANAPINSVGQPEAQGFRVFSTLNSPGPFATTLGVLILLALGRGGRWLLPLTAVGLVALGLSLVRSAWLGVAVGVVVLLTRGGSARRTIGTVVLMVPVLTLVLQSGPIGAVLAERAGTVGDISDDQSFQDRLRFFGELAPQVLSNPVGTGVGSTGAAARVTETSGSISDFDNGLLEIPFSLGLVGAVLYYTGLFKLIRTAFSRGGRAPDLFDSALAAAVSAALVQLLFVNVLKGVTGIVIFLALGLLAARDPEQQEEPRESPAPAGTRP